jgi:hypothetical protein
VAREDTPTCRLTDRVADVRDRVRAFAEMAHFMDEHKLDSSPITTSDGRLVGLLLRADLSAHIDRPD